MFNKAVGDTYLPYIKGESKEPMPLYIKPDHKLSVRDVQRAMRDHYEGTPLDITNDPGAGPFKTPYRLSPLTYKVGDKEYLMNARFLLSRLHLHLWHRCVPNSPMR